MMSLALPNCVLFFLIISKDLIFFSSSFTLDPISTFMLWIFPLVSVLLFSPMFSFSSIKEASSHLMIFGSVLFFLLLCFSSSNSFFFLLFLENCAMFMFTAIILFSKDSDKVSSALFMLFINIFPSIMFMFFCAKWEDSLNYLIYTMESSSSMLCFFSFLGLLLVKLPLFSLHFWLTKAHVSASGCGSMILASLLLKLGSMGLFKFYFIFNLISFSLISQFFSLVSWFSIVLLLVMLRFFDLKYMVACSSIIHMGPLFCMILQGGSVALLGACLMQVGHGLVSYFIFFLVSLMYEGSHHRSLDYNKGFSSSSPLFLMFIFLFFLCNLGFPPLCSFLSEILFLYCFMLFDFSIFMTFLFSLILGGIIFFFVASISIFGKKSLMTFGSLNCYTLLFFLLFLLSFMSLPFIIF